MRKLLLTTAALVALTADNSFAADLPTKATAYKVPPAYFTWTGCYLGGNVGAASARAKFTTTLDPNPAPHVFQPDSDRVHAAGTGSDRDTSLIGGGQVGCNFQTGAFVLGVEGDFSGLSTHSTLTGAGMLTTADPFSITNSVKNDWLATVRGRVGFAVDRSLIYVTGGAAFSKLRYSQVYTDAQNDYNATGGFNVSHTKTGWTIGAGWEYAYTNNWSIKAEYLHVRFSSFGGTGLIADTVGFTNVTHGTVREDIDIARLGLNYRFGG